MASAMRSRQQPAPRRSVASVNMRQSGTPKPSTPKRSRIARQQTSSQFSQNSQVSQSSAQSPAPQHPAPQPPATWTQSPVVRALPRPQPAPAWLKVLIKVQRLSSMPTLLLIIGLLAVYGWTVYTQQRWGQAYRHLEALQKQERQLTAASEVLKIKWQNRQKFPV
ncbi:MAG: hypothetical protein HC772_10940 [Leptolyngbyaceae cyanobacterium CRU_2_3]|nr:hypothetical protein [Leptolyngbyaceae cyanobacterium CRU_2_3]